MSDETKKQPETKSKISIYIVVFGVMAALIAAAGLSTLVFNKNLSAKNVSLSNLQNLGPAPNMQGIAAWINSPPLSIPQLRERWCWWTSGLTHA